jgi:hypothetical protein
MHLSGSGENLLAWTDRLWRRLDQGEFVTLPASGVGPQYAVLSSGELAILTLCAEAAHYGDLSEGQRLEPETVQSWHLVREDLQRLRVQLG